MTRHSTAYGAYEIESLPSQPQIAHCHGLFVRPEHRGNGHGHALKAHQMQTLRELGYDYATCTIDAQNERQRTVLMKAGWRLLGNIQNSKTCGITQLWGWQVNQ